MTVGRIFTKIYIFISLSWAFFRKPEKLGSHSGSKWWPGDPDVKDDPNDPLTWWPNDPVPCLVQTPKLCCDFVHHFPVRQISVPQFSLSAIFTSFIFQRPRSKYCSRRSFTFSLCLNQSVADSEALKQTVDQLNSSLAASGRWQHTRHIISCHIRNLKRAYY